jgi:hypothetical protein
VRIVAFALAFLAWSGVALADRIPVAVLWLGDASTVDQGQKVADDVYRALNHFAGARPLDASEERAKLVEGGAATRELAAQARGDALLVKTKCADAVKEYAEAERLLLEETPFELAQRRLGAVERNLLVCYDQLGKADDAARAAERLGWTAGSNDDVKALIDRHLRSRAWQPARAPVKIVTDPAGGLVYRNLQPVGAAPIDLVGGDPSVDVVDVELAGFRRAHQTLGHGGEVRVQLVKEDRLGELVDHARMKAPDAPPAEVAAIGKKIGAARVLALYPDNAKVIARWLDVSTGKWAPATIKVDATGTPSMERLAGYVAPRVEGGEVAETAQPSSAAAVKKAPPPPAPAKSKWGAWGKWYTWVAAGGVLVLVGALLIAQNVGSDSLKVEVTH